MSKPLGHRFPETLPIWLLAGLWLFLPGSLAAQTVTLLLRNGDRITGSITSEDSSRIVLATSWSKEVTVATGEVTKRETLSGESTGGSGPARTNALATAPAATASAVPARRAPAPPAPSPPVIEAKKPKYWAAEVQLGVDLA